MLKRHSFCIMAAKAVNGKGEIIGDHFVDQIVNESDGPAVSAMEAVMDKYMKE